jgi:hypothetical protein
VENTTVPNKYLSLSPLNWTKITSVPVAKSRQVLFENHQYLNPMEKRLYSTHNAFNSTISLQHLINNLVNSSLPAAHHKNTHVVNEVEKGIALGTAMQHAMGIMNDILTTIVANSRNGEIHITAGRFRDVVTLEFEERNNYNGYALAYSIGSIEPAAASLGGHISMKGPQQKITTISFSFPDSLLAA